MTTRKKENGTRRIVGLVLLSICGLFLLYFAAVLIYRLSTASSEKIWSAVTRFLAEIGFLCVLSLPALDVTFGIFSWKRNRAAKAAGRTIRILSCAICAVFLALGMAIMITGALGGAVSAEKVCVLGLAIDGEKLPKDLTYRLEKTLEYQSSYPNTIFIVTGGNGDDPTRSEAAQMARYLEGHGFYDPDDKLILETEASTTVENFKNVASFLDKSEAIGVITNDYHMFRATKIAKKQGYANLIPIAAPSVPSLYCENVMWESICFIFETVRGNTFF